MQSAHSSCYDSYPESKQLFMAHEQEAGQYIIGKMVVP